MKLSEAIRKGAEGRTKVTGDFISINEVTQEADPCKVCALGAALIGLKGEEEAAKLVMAAHKNGPVPGYSGSPIYRAVMAELQAAFPVMQMELPPNGLDGSVATVGDRIWQINDLSTGSTFETIAEQVEKWEAKYEAQ